MHHGQPGDRVLVLLRGHAKATFAGPDRREIAPQLPRPRQRSRRALLRALRIAVDNVLASEPVEAQALSESKSACDSAIQGAVQHSPGEGSEANYLEPPVKTARSRMTGRPLRSSRFLTPSSTSKPNLS
jgi:hypothetical protein